MSVLFLVVHLDPSFLFLLWLGGKWLTVRLFLDFEKATSPVLLREHVRGVSWSPRPHPRAPHRGGLRTKAWLFFFVL